MFFKDFEVHLISFLSSTQIMIPNHILNRKPMRVRLTLTMFGDEFSDCLTIINLMFPSPKSNDVMY